LIGAGGGARAAFRYFVEQGVENIAIVVRDPARAAAFIEEAEGARVEIHPIDACEPAFAGAAAIVNASPLGMEGSPLMPPRLLEAVATHAGGATLFDMVYKPLRTDFLAAGEAAGGEAVDGLVMLIGQARAAFELFFGRPAPEADQALRDLLTG
jgi:shikimate dehydrogenase